MSESLKPSAAISYSSAAVPDYSCGYSLFFCVPYACSYAFFPLLLFFILYSSAHTPFPVHSYSLLFLLLFLLPSYCVFLMTTSDILHSICYNFFMPTAVLCPPPLLLFFIPSSAVPYSSASIPRFFIILIHPAPILYSFCLYSFYYFFCYCLFLIISSVSPHSLCCYSRVISCCQLLGLIPSAATPYSFYCYFLILLLLLLCSFLIFLSPLFLIPSADTIYVAYHYSFCCYSLFLLLLAECSVIPCLVCYSRISPRKNSPGWATPPRPPHLLYCSCSGEHSYQGSISE